MTELWLKYKDENGAPKRVLVEGEKFSVGRTPDNDLSIPLPNLSRRHIRIERFADVFILSDVGSSNGTTLDGADVTEPVALKNGNKINLGGGAEIEVEMISDEPAADGAPGSGGSAAKEESGNKAADAAQSASIPAEQSASGASSGNSIPFGFFIIAPLLGFFILAIVGVFIFLSRPDDSIAGKRNGGIVYTSQTENQGTDETDSSGDTVDKDNKKDQDNIETAASPAPTVASNSNSGNSAAVSSSPDQIEISSTPKTVSDSDKLDRAAVSFLRRIAANDSKAFLTGKQIAAVSSKVNQFKNSGALAENLKNAKRNSVQIEELARSKSLRPQFVATAALARLGNQSGDVLKTAQGMIEVLSNLRATLGNELADDTLLIIAAYDQGAANQNLVMRDTVANLTNKFPNVSSRTVRTIWFLQENGKLSPEQYDFALKFLAIGIITQNPKDFGVQSEAVIFN